MSKYYTTKEFAERIGVAPVTLRLWDRQGKLKPAFRTLGNQRRYTEEQVLKYFSGSMSTK